MEAVDTAERITVIQPTRRFSLNLRELWAFRELLFFLVWRDVKVRYKQTVLGALWAILQPVAAMLIFTLVFGRLVKIASDGLPYAVFAYAGLLPWFYFANCLSQSSLSLVGNSNLITKIYFPRLLIPLASVAVPLIDFLIAFVVLLGLMAVYGIVPGLSVLALPAFVALALLTAFGIGLWLSALNVRYRDVPYVIPFLTQIWMYASPVVYPTSLVPEHWRWVYSLNPMVGVIEGFRWSALGAGEPSLSVVGVSAGAALVAAVSGVVYFRTVERHFADVI